MRILFIFKTATDFAGFKIVMNTITAKPSLNIYSPVILVSNHLETLDFFRTLKRAIGSVGGSNSPKSRACIGFTLIP